MCLNFLLAYGYFSFPVVLSLSRRRSEFSLRMKRGKLTDGEMRKYLQMEVRACALVSEDRETDA